MTIIPRPWERDAKWRSLQFAFLATKSTCDLCGLPADHLHAMPRNTDRPYDDFVAVCGQCKPNAMTRRLLTPSDETFTLSPWAVANSQMPPMPQALSNVHVGFLPSGDPRKDAFMRQRARILTRDDGRCRYCGLFAKLIDRVDKSKDDDENFVAVCGTCHRFARTRSFPTFEEKRDWIMNSRKAQERQNTPKTKHPYNQKRQWRRQP